MVLRDGVRADLPIPREMLDQGEEPSAALPAYAAARLGLRIESFIRNHSEILGKLGIKLEKLDLWTRHILTNEEWRHGLATAEKGEWGTNFILCAKKQEQVPDLQQEFAKSMMWEMTKGINVEKPKLAIDLRIDKNVDGQVSAVEPELTKRNWPIVVRVLKQGTDGEPVAFVDVEVEKRIDGANPYQAIDWQRIVRNDEQYIVSLGERVGEQRSLDEWYEVGEAPERIGVCTRPDIILGCNTGEFKVQQMMADRRAILVVGIEPVHGKVGGVQISTLTHLPYDGMDMLGSGANMGGKTSAYEATLAKPEIVNKLEDDNAKDEIEGYLFWRDQNDQHVVPMKTWLSRRYGRKKDDLRTRVENLLRVSSFENPAMADFAWKVDAQKVLVEKEISEDLAGELVKLPKELRREKKNISGIFLLNMALFLQGFQSQGYAIKPRDLRERLAYGTVGNPALRRVLTAAGLIKDKSSEQAMEKHVNRRLAVNSLRERVQDMNGSEDGVRLLRGLREATAVMETGGPMLAQTAADVIAEYQNDMKKAEYVYLNEEMSEGEEINPGDLTRRFGLLDFAAYQKGLFGLLYKSIEGTGRVISPEQISELNYYSAGILTLGKLREGFPLGESDIQRVIERYNQSVPKDRGIVINGEKIDWGTNDREVMKNRIREVSFAIRRAAMEKFEEDGIKYILDDINRCETNKDETGINRIFDDLLEQAGTIAEMITVFTDDATLSAMGVNVRLGPLLRKLEFLGMWGGSALLASARPTQNASKLVTKDLPGTKACFSTAMGANGTTLGIAQENNRLSAKESIDNPVNMLDVVVPFLRGNGKVANDFRLFLERNNYKEKDLDLVEKMVFGEEYMCFTDSLRGRRGEDIEYIDGQARIWGNAYEERLRGGAMNALKRWNNRREANKFFEMFNAYLGEVQTGRYRMELEGESVDLEAREVVRRFMGGGFGQMWEAVSRFRLAAVEAELSQVITLFGLWRKSRSNDPEYDKQVLLPLRAIRQKELRELQQEHKELKRVYQEFGGQTQ